jgi:EAL domain-containing protein (putative c-di-GMP-specific phosphodiesterase class I)
VSAKDVDPLLHQMDGELAGWSEPAERLRQALLKDELTLFCQPIAALDMSRPGAVRFPMAEVLVRLREEEKALLPPGDFLPAFEHYRLMPDLDRWVVRELIRHIVRGLPVQRFAVNVSSQTLEDVGFAKAVALELVSAGVPGTSLLFEIAEGDTIARLEQAIKFSTAIRAVGCGLMVDGFGRRSATFMALKSLRPDFVKIDGVITRKIVAAPAAEAKLKAVLRVGEVMGFQCIAEMVEEQEVLTRLQALGVGFAQGFGIRPPHAIEKLTAA